MEELRALLLKAFQCLETSCCVMTLKQGNKSSQGSHTREMEDSSAEDLISDLPDELLLNIFSFLDETAIIQSSVLSSRWKYLWTLVPFPEHVKQKRSYFKKQKMEIREKKLRLEEVASNSVSKVFIDVAKFTGLYFILSLHATMIDWKMFVGFHLLITPMCMDHIYSSCMPKHVALQSNDEEDMKRLQERDSRLTSAANSYSTSKPMELLFPDNFQPRYAKTAKLYGLLGVLLVMIMSCGSAVLKWKFEFILETDGPRRILIGNLGIFSLWIGYLLYFMRRGGRCAHYFYSSLRTVF